MLINKFRLRKNTDIEKIFQYGKNIHSKYFLVKYLPNQKKVSQLAISVSTKISKKAVFRNRIKRIIREEFYNQLNTINSLDILIIAKKELLKASASDIKNDLKGLILKLKKNNKL